MTNLPIEVRPIAARPSKRGSRVLMGVGIIGIAIGWLLRTTDPPIFALIAFSAAVAVFFAAGPIARRTGQRWLLADPQPLAVIHPDRLEITDPDFGVRSFAWREIDGLRAGSGLNGRPSLIGPNGETLTDVPVELVRKNINTLADAVTKALPEQFEMRRYGPGRLMRSRYEFDRRRD